MPQALSSILDSESLTFDTGPKVSYLDRSLRFLLTLGVGLLLYRSVGALQSDHGINMYKQTINMKAVYPNTSLFVQDEWKINDRLSLS
jgi:hypothetical protein